MQFRRQTNTQSNGRDRPHRRWVGAIKHSHGVQHATGHHLPFHRRQLREGLPQVIHTLSFPYPAFLLPSFAIPLTLSFFFVLLSVFAFSLSFFLCLCYSLLFPSPTVAYLSFSFTLSLLSFFPFSFHFSWKMLEDCGGIAAVRR